MSSRRKVVLIDEEGKWSAIDEELGVGSCGDTRQKALEMLDEAVELHQREGEPATNDDLREFGLDPNDVDHKPLPEFMQ